MSSTADFPGALPTNTYLLHEFSEIAYLVVKAAQTENTQARQSTLPRLKNAEQHFRRASILTALDSDKLELFTFYKKVDLVKDQKTILSRFGHVCKLNHCIIESRKTCRIVDLLEPGMSREYRLFTNAVISSLQLEAQYEGSLQKLSPHVFLLKIQESVPDGTFSFESQPTRWSLHEVELQIVATGQLLLFVKNAKWPLLTAMTDLIDPDVDTLDQCEGATLYLAPTGQIARYNGVWVSSMTAEQEASVAQRKGGPAFKRQIRWIKLAQEWLNGKIDASVRLQVGTIWLELKIPVLAKSEAEDAANDEDARTLQWKTIYWPAALSYAFGSPIRLGQIEEISLSDPLEDARDWLFHDCDAALKARDDEAADSEQKEDRLFDDDMQFGSPQQYMHAPMHPFANAQTVYPTPPDAPFAQATPGFSVDGTVQTPATIPQFQANTTFSSPLATVTETPVPHRTEQEIPQFPAEQEHEHDDLFEDNEDEKLIQDTMMNEPDWDCFESDALQSEMRLDQEDIQATKVEDAAGGSTTDHNLTSLSPSLPNCNEKEEPAGRVASTDPDTAGHGDTKIDAQLENNFSSLNRLNEQQVEEGETALSDLESHQPVMPGPYVSPEDRRSSVYDLPQPIQNNLDDKYRAQGKYWFEPNRLNPKPAQAIDSQRPDSSSSTVSSGSSGSDVSMMEPAKPEKYVPPWTIFEPSEPKQTQGVADEDEQQDAEDEIDIRALLQVIGSATGSEPFLSPMPVRALQAKGEPQDERSFMVVQTLVEQISQSTLLRKLEALHVPVALPASAIDITINNAGSNAVTSSASVCELSAVPQANPPKASDSRIIKLKNVKVCLSQAENDIVADVSILHFWQTIGLHPLNGNKDVLAICLHPASANYKNGCETFLDRMSQTWDSCNLGAHHQASLEGLTKTGTVSWSSPDELNSFCREVGEVLAAEGHETCTVVYMIIPNDDMSWCMRLCDAFVELFEALLDQRQHDTGDIVLQLVPASFVVTSNTIVVPHETEYVDLALEVYHRVPPLEDSVEGVIWAPPLRLEEPTVPNLSFDLSSVSVSPLKRHGECLHLSYGITQDKLWLVASWADSVGNITITVPYRLWNDEQQGFVSRKSIYRHMLDTTVGLANSQRERWWLAIAKNDFYDYQELQDWNTLIGQCAEEQKLLSRAALLTIELTPQVTVSDSLLTTKNQQSYSSNGQIALSTPVSTPQALNTTSPDHGIPVTPTAGQTGAPTPPETILEHGFENDMILKDPTEDTWMIMLPFGLNQSHDMLEIRPALASGLLLKKVAVETRKELQTTIIGVNLVLLPWKSSASTAAPTAEREQLLEEVMVQYRALHTLAIAKRNIESTAPCVPWHVASVWKGVRCLDYLV